MRCEIFLGTTPQATISNFNEWAKGKRLAKDMIIQSVMAHSSPTMCPDLVILVFHSEEKEADVPKPEVKSDDFSRAIETMRKVEEAMTA